MTKTRNLANLGGGFIQTGAGVQRTVESKLQDMASIKDFGAVGNGIADDTSAINLAIATGKPIYFPPGTYKVPNTINLTTKQNWYGSNAILKLDRTGTYIVPLLNIKSGANFSSFEGIEFDHNSNGIAQPALADQASFWMTNCVVVQADDVSIRNCTFRNAWDSGVGIGRINQTGDGSVGSPFTSTAVTGQPFRCTVDNSRAYDCGLGQHSGFGEVGKKGGGFNNGNGSGTIISNCLALQCYGGFINDFGAGANAIFTGCTAITAKLDVANPSNASGVGFWIADGPVSLIGCSALFCENHGIVFSEYANGPVATGCYAYSGKKHGFYIMSPNATLDGCVAGSNSLETTNTFSGFCFDSTVALTSVTLNSCRTYGSSHKYSVDAIGANVINATIDVPGLQGATTGIVNQQSYAIALTNSRKANTRNIGFERINPKAKFVFAGATVSWSSIGFGDIGNEGIVAIEDISNTTKRLALAYDIVNDLAVLQAAEEGSVEKPIFINPSGGDVRLSTGVWDTGCTRLGSNYLWVDSSGRLRIKGSAPSSDTDGTVVGTQS